jgi:hypothetical protein
MFNLRPALLLATLLLALQPLSALAGDALFKLSDPRGDDHGDGSLAYPFGLPDDFARGELDLVAFEAKPVSGGTQFTATFARPVRKPYRKAIDDLGTQLTDAAKLGFYNFNLDIYVDTDRKPGSGRVVTLPGRVAEVSPDTAWEKVICLTPRPDVAKIQLRRILTYAARKELKAERGRVSEGEADQITSQVTLELEQDYFFPTRVQVSGPKIRFVVPATFFGGGGAQPTWAYAVAVTASAINAEVEMAGVDDDSWVATYRGGRLMNLPVVPGGATGMLGTSKNDADLMPPILDILVPPGVTQETVLNDWDILAERLVRLPGVVPADVTPEPKK